MFSEAGKPGRKQLVYGKVKRSTHAYNIFDLDDVPSGGIQGRTSPQQDETRLPQQHIQGQIIKSIEKTHTGKLNNIHHRVIAKQKQLSSGLFTQNEFGQKKDRDDHTSAFDIPLSGNEDNDNNIVFEKSKQKRRRLTPVRNHGTHIVSHQPEPSRSEARDEHTGNKHVKKSLCAHTLSQSESKATSQFPKRPKTPIPDQSELRSKVSLFTPPKQTRLLSNLLDSASQANSPSMLPLTSLRLTNEKSLRLEVAESSSKSFLQTEDGHRRTPRPKRRLIDSMVSPRKGLSVSTSSEISSDTASDVGESICDAGDKTSQVQPADIARSDDMNGVRSTGDMVLSDSSASLGTSSKPIATYSRERSHLADMLPEDLLDSSSQQASQGSSLSASQNAAIFSSFDSAVVQDELEEDLGQEVAGIRSIHELRQAGGNARSQVDLESILEDFEAKGSSARARRLRGLAQLAERLRNPEIGRYIIDQSLDQRLCGCPDLDGDLVGKTLLTMILSRLMVSVQLPISSLKGLFETIMRFGITLIHEAREFRTMVRDRQQNLSRLTYKELTALVEPFCSSLVWPNQRPMSPTPQLIFVRALDILMRQVRQLGDFSMAIPASLFNQLVELLLRVAPTEVIEKENSNAGLLMESTVSIIESLTISNDWAEDGCLEIAKKLSRMGPMLSQLTASSAGDSERTQHLILRLILNITNNDSELCNSFSEPTLLSAIFGIIQRDFLQTPMLDNGVLKDTKLEGVILALGTLSNLAEHSDSFRHAALSSSLDGKSMVDWIASAFRDQVDVASEVISLLPIGYRSYTDSD
jgi:Wings apart-like protein regulation of heterochromatin